MKVKLDLEYSGGAFSGWQVQPGLLTVQGELERALSVYFSSLAKKAGSPQLYTVPVMGSGRTDAGVHARHQVASFSWPVEFPFDAGILSAALNGITVPELVVLGASLMPDNFDARHSPHVKSYSYSLLLRDTGEGLYAGRSWSVRSDLDVPAMVRAARMFVGEHDFSSFRARDCTAVTTVRTLLRSELSRVSASELRYETHGKGFLKQMIRIIVGTLVRVGEKRLAPDDIKRILEARDRTVAGETAPAHGLTLEWVRY